MAHVHNHDHKTAALDPRNHALKDYAPLAVVFLFIGLSGWLYARLAGGTLEIWLGAIMGFFFLYFALFKLIDLSGFKNGYQEYDVIAGRIPGWGYLYPFIELTLGVLYLLGDTAAALHIATILITGLNVLGVALKVARKEQFMCACLGTVLKVPLTTVTLIEYGLMGAMALYMLLAL